MSDPVLRSRLRGGIVGVAAATVGLLPHLLAGARLPLQNLWALDTDPDDYPWTLLPVSQYYAWWMVAMLVAGGVLAGLLVRALTMHEVSRPTAALGVGLMHSVAIGQSYWHVAYGLQVTVGVKRAVAYFVVMLAVAVAGAIFAQGCFWLVTTASVAPAAFGLVLGSIPVVEWLITPSTVHLGAFASYSPVELLRSWLPAILAGLALAWCGSRRSRAWVWGASLAALWLMPTIVAPLQFVAGSRSILSQPSEIPAAVFQQVLDVAPRMIGIPIVALIVGVVGALFVRRWNDGAR